MIAVLGSAPGGPSLLVIEAGATLIAVAATACWPAVGTMWLSKTERCFGRMAQRRGLSVVTVGAAALPIRLAILPLSPISQPFIHDEFANLLAADTFASGRTNQSHSSDVGVLLKAFTSLKNRPTCPCISLPRAWF
jgi:hypothetical protein